MLYLLGTTAFAALFCQPKGRLLQRDETKCLIGREKKALGNLLRRFTIDLGLGFAERIAFAGAAFGGVDAALAAPAQPLAGTEAVHLVTWMMDAAAVAKKHFRHDDLTAVMLVSKQHSWQNLRQDYAFGLSSG